MIADGGGPRIEGRGMNQGDSGTANTADREIANTRIFDAPRELIWKAWTDPKHVSEWWGPSGLTNTTHAKGPKLWTIRIPRLRTARCATSSFRLPISTPQHLFTKRFSVGR